MHAASELFAPGGHGPALLRAFSDPYKSPVLRCAKIKLTARCNLRCSYCQYWRMREPDELSTPQVKSIVSDLKALGCVKVHFSGGEAMLRKDLFELIRFTADLGIRPNLTTNATLLSDERIRALLDAGAHSVSTSLDGPTRKIHDRARGMPGAFDRTVDGIRALVRARDRSESREARGLKLRLNVVLTRHNYQTAAEMIDLAANLGMTDVVPIPVDENNKNPINRLGQREIRDYNRHIAPLVHEARERAGFSTAAHLVWPFGRSETDTEAAADGHYARGYFAEHLCYVPWLHLFVAWNGDVALCCMARGKTAVLGNLRQSTVAEVFNGEHYQAVRREFLTARPAVCHGCDMFVVENQAIHAALTRIGLGRPQPVIAQA
jgi:MoaA/NifB/PqqE/SkfB family radical SAM enzyme